MMRAYTVMRDGALIGRVLSDDEALAFRDDYDGGRRYRGLYINAARCATGYGVPDPSVDAWFTRTKFYRGRHPERWRIAEYEQPCRFMRDGW